MIIGETMKAKEFKNLDEQVEILRRKGLTIKDEKYKKREPSALFFSPLCIRLFSIVSTQVNFFNLSHQGIARIRARTLVVERIGAHLVHAV